MGVPISNVTRRVVFAASGTGPYAFTFEILANTDIAVYKDDALLTLTTDYTVTINANGTGSITLTAAPTGATQIAIVGNRTIQRTSDFVTGGDFFANTVNTELDQLTIFAQQNSEGLQRALSAPQTDPTSINMTLPRAALRANKALGFDASGNPTIADTIGTNRGNWASGTLYYIRDIVKDTTNNNIWQCLVQHTSTGSQPINTNTDSAKWTLLVDADSATASATAAASSASAAATSASNASTSASNASSSASTASTQASNASTSATNAASSASAAASSATSAASSATSAAASFDAFDDRYLGSKASDPTVDNDGNTLLDGALYWDTTNNILKVYDLGATTWRRTTPTSSDQSNINTVSGISADVTTVAGIAANVTTVAGISANVTSVAGNSTNINTVATNIANVNATGGSIASVNTVAGSIASVNTNATNIANINQNAANITAIQNASTNATNAANSATAAATSATNAAASAASASAVVLGNEPVRPAIRPTLLLDFANTKQLDPRITFSRASTATYYDGKTTAKAEENLVLRSQEFDEASWSPTGLLSRTANTTAAPDGTTTADTLTEDSSNTIHRVFQQFTTVAQPYAVSCFFKANTRSWAYLRLTDSGGVSRNAFFNLSTGVLGTVDTNLTATITSAGNGWYRCVAVVNLALAGLNTVSFGMSNADNTITYTGDGTSSVFVWGAQVEQRSAVTAYTATTTQSITNYIPVLQTAASGVARFEHNPVTGESLGLEIEEQRTNLLLRSEEFDNASWTKERASVTANTIVSPDGTLNGDKLVEDTTANNSHTIYQAVAGLADNTTHIASFYLKAAERTRVVLSIMDKAATTRGMLFDLSAGTVSSFNQNGVTDTSISGIQSVGNGWYRCWVGHSVGTGAFQPRAWLVLTNGTTNLYTGNGFSGVFVWGAQLEAGAFATSYIPTTSAQVTRAADAAVMTGTNFSSWYNAAEGTMYSEYATSASTSKPVFVIRATASESDRIQHATSNSVVVVSGVSQCNIGSGTNITSGKQVFAYKTNDFAGIIQGLPVSTIVNTDTSGTLPTVSYATIGHFDFGGGDRLSGTIRKIAYYPLRVTNAQLQAMTTV